MARTRHFWWDDGDVCFVLEQHAELDFYCGSSLKKLSTGRLDMSLYLNNVSWFREKQSFFLLLQCSILSGEAAHTNLKVACLNQTVLDPMIYHTRGEPANYHTIDLFIMHITEIHRTVEWCPFAFWVNKSCRINSPVTYGGSYCLIFSFLCSIASTIVRLFMILLMTIILSALPRITSSVLNILTASVLNTPLICSTCHKHFPVLSSFMTYHRVCNQINTMGATSGSRTAYPSGVQPRFSVRFVLLDL